jgi:uroporphyrinogen decarboxylase
MKTSRQRALTSLSHQQPDRTPVDLLAVPEIWNKLLSHFQVSSREEVLQILQVDCRRVSYDSFAVPPERITSGGVLDWTDHPARTTTERVFRLRRDERLLDIWGARRRLAVHPFGTYEELAEFPLAKAESLADLAAYDWPTPNWFDFSALPAELKELDKGGEVHIRYRIGSLFETAWSLRGFEQMLMDLVESPEIPGYIMDRILEVHLANLEAAVKAAGGRLDMVYYYDDLASMENLLMSPAAYRRVIKPRQEKLLSAAKAHGLPVMYHCDGSIFKLIPDLMEMGVTLLNPIQVNAKDMSAANLKQAFGEKLSFHGGVDIVNLLPKGTEDEVRAGIRSLVQTLGQGGGYILAPSHHLQGDTPLANVLAMYETDLR